MSAERASASSIEGGRSDAASDGRSATWLFAAAALVVIGAVGAWRLMTPDASVSAVQKPGYAAAAMAATGKGAPAQVDARVATGTAVAEADVGAVDAAGGTLPGDATPATADAGQPGG